MARLWLLIAFLLVWEILGRWVGKPVQFPPLSVAASAIVDLIAKGELFMNIWESLRRILIGFTVAAAIGIPLGIAMGLSRYVHRLFDPLIESLRPISSIAWIPLFLSIFGIGDQIAISVVVYARDRKSVV